MYAFEITLYSSVPSTLELKAGTQISTSYLNLNSLSTIIIEIGEQDPYAALSLYDASSEIFIDGTLIVNEGEGSPTVALGTTRTLVELNYFGGATIGTPFPNVFTNPPLGREYEISGNEYVSSSNTATLVFAESFTDDQFD